MTITALTDAELLNQARGGDDAAFTELYVRHQAAAKRLASTYTRISDPDDLVNGAFERVLGAIRRGGGPTESFRAYLFVTLRRLAAEKGERPADEPLDEVPEPVGDEADAPGLDRVDRELITTAFESLPDRWQAVLWHTAVEGRQPRELAAVLGVSANAAAAMAYRAREKLRQAYLQAHLLASPSPEHEPYRSQLGAYVRDGLSARDRAAVQAHLDGCEPCRDLVAELNDVNRMLVRSVAPLFLLGGMGGAAAAAGVGGAAAVGSDAGGKGAGAAGQGFVGKLKHLAPTVGTVAAIAAVVAGLAGLGLMTRRDDPGPVDKARDARDIGAPSDSDRDGSSGGSGSDSGSGADSGAGDSVFGGDDFALAPFDDGSGLDDSFFADFGEGSGVDEFDTFGSGSSSRSRRRATTPPASTPTSPAPPPATAPPTTPPATSPTTPSDPPPSEPTPAPPTLAFSTSVWTPLAAGQGTLSVTIGEAGVTPGLTATAFSAPAGLTAVAEPDAAAAADQPAQLRLELSLTAAAAADPEGTLDDRCATPETVPGPLGGQMITCLLDQPPTGGTDTFTFALEVDAPDQTAMLRLFRGDALEAELPTALPLDRLEDGLGLTDSTWTPYPGRGSVQLPLGELSVGATNAGTRPVPNGSIRITLAGHAGFVPPQLFSDQLPPGGMLEAPALANVLPPELRDLLLTRVLDPLPAGCAIEGWTPPTGETGWAQVLLGGLPHTMVCQLDELAPGATLSFPTLLAATNPLYTGPGDGAGDPHATVQLELGGVPVGPPADVDMRSRGEGPVS
jgi:RNA polymerase sigma factor (sigma-70 family)